MKDSVKYNRCKSKDVWRCVRTFKDVDLIYSFSPEQFDFYTTLDTGTVFNDTIANITWRLGHYPDNTETPIEFVIRYIMCNTSDKHLIKICTECVK